MWRRQLFVVALLSMSLVLVSAGDDGDEEPTGPCRCPADVKTKTEFCGGQIHRDNCNENGWYSCEKGGDMAKLKQDCDSCVFEPASKEKYTAKCFTGKMVPSKHNAGEESEEVKDFDTPPKEIFPPLTK